VNGIIFGIPFIANMVLIYNPSTDQISSSPTVPREISPAGNWQWRGGVVVNSIVYAIPKDVGKVLIYNPRPTRSRLPEPFHPTSRREVVSGLAGSW
jgi:hypothetical protein